MRRQLCIKLVLAIAMVAALAGMDAGGAAACSTGQQSCSGGYGVSEAFLGNGGALCDPGQSGSEQSTNYCAKVSVGETGVGNSSSTNYQAQAGFNTDRTPSLTFVVTSTNINLGTLSPGTPATGLAHFSVKTYLASGYQVVTAADPPANGAHLLTAMSSAGPSNPSTEQFGINLVANSSCGGGLPASLGANPVQVPDATFSFGAAASGYDTACQFKYHNGDTIAHATKSSGETDFTISYLINISNVTPGGTYTMDHVLVATSTF
ncbi:MAG TPA: hypothetical protein VHC98_01265 [Candidatus Saccharimonadales bacterium]|nr:hypothetical protein [Candidatus Saccharimonadales bacterium]